MSDELTEYLGYSLDAQQNGMQWQVHATAGQTVPQWPVDIYGSGTTREKAYRDIRAKIDEFWERQPNPQPQPPDVEE